MRAFGMRVTAVGPRIAQPKGCIPLSLIQAAGSSWAGHLLQVGGRLGNVFDEDPKRWRMLAETLATLGLSLEISTAFFPGVMQCSHHHAKEQL